jgi:hypothetical protein
MKQHEHKTDEDVEDFEEPSLPPPEPFERIYGYDVEEYDPYGDGRDDKEL